MGCGAERLQRLRSQPPRQPFSLRPLSGRRIVVTRAREQAAELVDALTKLGAQVIAAPTIRIEPLTDLGALRAALADLSRYDWIAFPSQNTVDVVCGSLADWGLAARGAPRSVSGSIRMVGAAMT